MKARFLLGRGGGGRKESFIWSLGECRVKSEMANYVNFVKGLNPGVISKVG